MEERNNTEIQLKRKKMRTDLLYQVSTYNFKISRSVWCWVLEQNRFLEEIGVQ